MKRNYFRLMIIGAMIGGVNFPVHSHLSAFENKASIVSEKDPKATEADELENKFSDYLQLSLLGVAWSRLDAKLMTDVALQLRNAERQLKAKHPKVSSEQLLQSCIRVATQAKDLDTIKRLKEVAKRDKQDDVVSELSQISTLIGASRDLRDENIFSERDIERGAVDAFGNLILQIKAAQLTGDKPGIDALKKYIDGAPALSPSHRQRLLGVIDVEGTVGDEKLSGIMNQFIGASRGFEQEEVENLEDIESLELLDGASRGGPNRVPTTLVVPEDEPESHGHVSYAAGGMRYHPTSSGAIVQSHGRLGAILFEPGDVIMSLGGVSTRGHVSIDSAIDRGYETGFQRVTVRDRNTGRVFTLRY